LNARAALFDLDGVLADVDYVAAAAFFEQLLPMSLSELGRRLQRWPEEHADSLEHLSIWSSFWDELADELGLAAQTRRALHDFDYRSVYRTFPDSRPALRWSKERGLRTGVLSNTPLVDLRDLLRVLGLSDLIDCVVFPQGSGVAKPAPAAYLRALALLQVEAKECLFFDDEPANVQGAATLGLLAFRVDRRRGLADVLLPNELRSLDELPNLFAFDAPVT
jgi:HAD superfamily hydrolase (TIGR01509 family)